MTYFLDPSKAFTIMILGHMGVPWYFSFISVLLGMTFKVDPLPIITFDNESFLHFMEIWRARL